MSRELDEVLELLTALPDARPEGVQIFCVDITPELATFLLERNENNRRIRPIRKKNYTQDISSNQWPFTGDSVVIDNTGGVLDGQHRLESIVDSGKSLPSIIVVGVKNSVFAYIDRGASRSLQDALYIMGRENPKELAAAINVAYWLDVKGAILKTNPPIQVALEWFKKNNDVIDHLDGLHKYRQHKGGISKPQMGGLMHHASKTLGIDQLETFAHKYYTLEDLKQNSPIMALYNTYIHHSGAPGTRLQQDLVIGWAITALNDWMEGVERKNRYRIPVRGGKNPEKFPQVKKPRWMDENQR